MERAPEVLPWEEDVSFFVNLLAAMRDGGSVVLVDGQGDVGRVTQAPQPNEIRLTTPHPNEIRLKPPHPQPFSPEYRGEGSKEFKLRGPDSPEYRGEGSEEVFCKGEVPEASAFGSQELRKEPEASAFGSQEHERRGEPEASAFGSRKHEGRIGLFTSGTTGKPKLVLHSVESLTRGVRCDDKHADDVWGLAYHPAHMAGLQVLFQALANRNTLVRLFGLPVESVHAAIEEQGVTHLSATPTFLNLMCSTGQVHKHVRSVTSGGELSSETLRNRLSTTFPSARLRNVYASTEVGSLLVATDDVFQVPERFHGRVRVLDGELMVHRSLLAPSLQQQLEGEYYATGDIVEVLQDDPLAFRITSREGHWINVGGYKVNPHEVEARLLAMDEVLEAAVFGRDNSVTGSLVCCDVVLSAGCTLTARDVHTRLSEHLPAYMIPRIVRAVDSIASTSSGKKQRTQ